MGCNNINHSTDCTCGTRLPDWDPDSTEFENEDGSPLNSIGGCQNPDCSEGHCPTPHICQPQSGEHDETEH